MGVLPAFEFHPVMIWFGGASSNAWLRLRGVLLFGLSSDGIRHKMEDTVELGSVSPRCVFGRCVQVNFPTGSLSIRVSEVTNSLSVFRGVRES